MARRKRRSPFHRDFDSFPSKRRRERSPFNYMQYIKQTSNSCHINQNATSDSDEAHNSAVGHVISVVSTNKLIEVENALKSSKALDASTIEWVINSLVRANDSNDIDVCSFLEKHDFFRRSDVFGMVLEMLTSDAPDINGWVENLVTLVLAVSKKQTIKTKFIKTILGFLSQIKSLKDPSVLNQIENAVDILEKREKYESLQDDCHSEIKMRADIKSMLQELITCEIFPTTEMVVKDKHLPLMLRDLRKPYKSPAHYLIEQFSLFLEDFIGPMRMGIKHYMDFVQSDETQGRFRDDNVRIYKRIRLLDNKCIAGSGVCLQIQFDTSTMKNIRWENCNFLQYGNLVCLTYDNCSDLTYALIANRDVKELSNGKIYLEIIEKDKENLCNLKTIPESRLVMIESKAFYPAYNHTLKSLQTMAENMLNENENIPFATYLVHLDKNVLEPSYTRQPNLDVRRVDFRCLLKENLKLNLSYDKIPILDVDQWPTMLEMGLNEDQYEALQKCLTKKIGILQGPPGTGKTWMGLRIMEFLLCNHHKLFKSDKKRPILLLSYTNHALDQFLEKLLESTRLKSLFRSNVQPFVRVGGRCTNEQVKAFTLTEHRKKRRKLWSENRTEMYDSLNSVKYIDTILMFLQTGIVSPDFLQKEGIISEYHYNLLKPSSDFTLTSNDTTLEWLGIFENSWIPGTEYQTSALRNADIDEFFLEEHNKRILDDDYGNNDKDREIENDVLELFIFTTNHLKSKRVPNSLKCFSVDCLVDMLSFVQSNLCRGKGVMRDESVTRIDNIWSLKFQDRWRLYRYWINDLSLKYQCFRENLVAHFNAKNKSVTQERFKDDLAIVKSCYMVGMTTTGAASNMNLLREIQPRIVVVEEAAQVHEQHVIGCLSNHLQHLILIGDHKQLRPTMNNHALKCEHKTDVSLMERLVMNDFPYHCLTKQHRMRPEICQLLTPAIYPSLENHSTVLTYPNLQGMKHNLYFFDHQNPETQSNFSTSYANDFEVEMIAELYKYLILQGYSNSDITILSVYNDQVRKIRNKVTEISQDLKVVKERCAQRIHITTVDNFQGEENRIVLLSLVRSNEKGKLGHLGDPQRICVSLSRAKEGLFVFGNFEMIYKRKNLLWLKIINAARVNEVHGNTLTLVCQNHPETITKISSPQDFKKVPDGGCDKLCSTQLECGHVCDRKCHADSSIHNLPCEKPCLKILCKNGHPCPKRCHQYCGPCNTKVEKTFSTCGHKVQILCSSSENFACPSECRRELACGHPCKLKCSEVCNADSCQVIMQLKHPQCGHIIMEKCCNKDNFRCTRKCSKTLKCGHTCEGNCEKCSNGRLHIPCKEICKRELVCGHTCTDFCCNPCPPCDKKFQGGCEHRELERCNYLCSEQCEPCQESCGWSCYKQCENKYVCSEKCSEVCNRPPCDRRCDKSLACKDNHRCIGVCGEVCPRICKRCDKRRVIEILNGSKDISKAVFVELIDCGHIFEVDEMDKYMGLRERCGERCGESEDKRVLLKLCPTCSTPIRRSGRYRNTIIETETDIKKINRKCENFLLSNTDGSFSLKDLTPYKQACELFPDRIGNKVSYLYCMNGHFKTVLEKFLNKANPRMEMLLEKKTSSMIPEIKSTFCVIFYWILSHSAICFTEDALENLIDEVERFLTHADLILIKDELENSLSSEDKNRIDFQIKTIGCPDGETFNRNDILSAQLLLNEIERDTPTSCMKLLKSKRRMFLKDVKCGKHGIWFKCRKGHIYLSEVGGTIDDPRCPDCLSTLNGTQCSPTEESNDDGSTGLGHSTEDLILSDCSEDPL